MFSLLSFSFSFCPCLVHGKRKRAQSPAAVLVRPWNALRETTKEDAPTGRILHFAGSRSKIFQVSPEPKRCVERKIVNYLTDIIANFRSFVDGNLQKTASRIATLPLLPWKGQSSSLFHTIIPRSKSYAEINKFACEDRRAALRLSRPILSAIRVRAPSVSSCAIPRGSAGRETRHPRHCHSGVRQSAI